MEFLFLETIAIISVLLFGVNRSSMMFSKLGRVTLFWRSDASLGEVTLAPTLPHSKMMSGITAKRTLTVFFCLVKRRFPSRPHPSALARAAVVKPGRRPPRSGTEGWLDGGEHGGTLNRTGGRPSSAECGRTWLLIMPPGRQHHPRLRQGREQRLVQAFIPQLAVETFNKRVLLRLVRRNVVPRHATILRPRQHGTAGPLRAVVAHHAPLAPRPLARHAQPRSRQARAQHTGRTARCRPPASGTRG